MYTGSRNTTLKQYNWIQHHRCASPAKFDRNFDRYRYFYVENNRGPPFGYHCYYSLSPSRNIILIFYYCYGYYNKHTRTVPLPTAVEYLIKPIPNTFHARPTLRVRHIKYQHWLVRVYVHWRMQRHP